jgi:hypothetical protein
MPLGAVGDDDPPPQAEANVASVAPDAIWQAPAQNRRRETGARGMRVSDIALVDRQGVAPTRAQYRRHVKKTWVS